MIVGAAVTVGTKDGLIVGVWLVGVLLVEGGNVYAVLGAVMLCAAIDTPGLFPNSIVIDSKAFSAYDLLDCVSAWLPAFDCVKVKTSRRTAQVASTTMNLTLNDVRLAERWVWRVLMIDPYDCMASGLYVSVWRGGNSDVFSSSNGNHNRQHAS